LSEAEYLSATNPTVAPVTPVRYAKATGTDMALSLLLPPVGLIIGVMALGRREARRGVTAIVLSLASAVAIWSALGALGIKDEYLTHYELASAARHVNGTTPVSVSRSVRLDGAESGPGLSFTYFFTLMDARDTAPGQTALDAGFVERMHSSVCASGQYKDWLARGITVHYVYRSNRTDDVGSMDFTAANCPVPHPSEVPPNSETGSRSALPYLAG
jgi:hypothetical protein